MRLDDDEDDDELFKDGLGVLIFDDQTSSSSTLSPNSEGLFQSSSETESGRNSSPTSDEFFLGLGDDDGMMFLEEEGDEPEKEKEKDGAAPAKPRSAPKSLQQPGKKRATEEDSEARLRRCLRLPIALFKLCNEGDLDGIRNTVNGSFDEKCTLKTHALKEHVTGREHVLEFFERLLDQFPDGMYKLRKAQLNKNGDVSFRFSFDGTSTASLSTFQGNPFMIAFEQGKCPMSRAGIFAQLVMQMAGRYFFPCERDALEQTEERMYGQKALGHMNMTLTGKMGFAPVSACATPSTVRVTRLDLVYKIKSVRAKHADFMKSSAAAAAAAGSAADAACPEKDAGASST